MFQLEIVNAPGIDVPLKTIGNSTATFVQKTMKFIDLRVHVIENYRERIKARLRELID